VIYEIKLRSAAQKQLDSINDKDYETLAKAVSSLAENPKPRGVKKMADSQLWRVRVKKYRIVYTVDNKNKEVIVVRVVRRSEDTYKDL
jgi:mRNA interferase RelE/StbE